MGNGGRPRSRSPLPNDPAMQNIVPLHLRPRKLNNWDVPPYGYEHMTAEQIKQLGMFTGAGIGAALRENPSALALATSYESSNPNAQRLAKRVFLPGIDRDVKEVC